MIRIKIHEMNNPFFTGQYQGTTEGLNMFEHCSAKVTGNAIPISVTEVHLNPKTREVAYSSGLIFHLGTVCHCTQRAMGGLTT